MNKTELVAAMAEQTNLWLMQLAYPRKTQKRH